jgi:PucR C-terminal helix-turn-helix domain/GGDEF-like domain
MSEFDRLIGELEVRVDALIDATLDRIDQRWPSWSTDTAFSLEQVREFERRSIEAQLLAFRRDTMPRSCPDLDAAAARLVARVGELELFLSGYRAAQVTLWEAWFELVEDSDLDGAERREALSRGSDFFFRYSDLLSDYVSVVYREEALRLRGDGRQRKFEAVKQLLEGDPPNLQSSAGMLDLELGQHHLGLIAWGEAGEEAARQLASVLGRRLLLVAPLFGTWWGWISGTRPLEAAATRAIGRFEAPPRSGLSIGMEEFGELGFRITHRQAQRARLLAPAAEPSLTLYSDVAVEALATENAEEARNFISRELGAIDDESTTSQRIRETLAAYFAAEHNAASAAASLGIHQQTVANRLRVAEERLGYPIGTRRIELELALRLRRALADSDQGGQEQS